MIVLWVLLKIMYPSDYSTGDDCMAPDNRGRVMGEFADMALDNIINGEYGMWCPRSGYGSSKKTIRCNKCSSSNVYWAQVKSGKWCLHTSGEPHICHPVRLLVPRTGKNSNKKELTGYKLIEVKCCFTCISYCKTTDRDNNITYECVHHKYSIIPTGYCKDWEKDE